MAYIGAEPVPGQNREVDDISSGFNGNATAFTLQVSSQNVSPESANNILVNLGGVLQNPGTDYTIAASTITFTTAPAAGLSFFGLILGAGINTATVADGTIGTAKVVDNSITADKLAHTSVTAGSYTTADITVDAQGRITAAASGTISGAEIADQAVTNAKVNNSAAIAGTKISPDFGSQAISTTNDSVTIGDSIIHSGDTNTKIRFPAADTVTVETAGSERIRIDSNGEVLIGTNSTSGIASSANDLVVSKSGNMGITIQSTDSSYSNLFYADSAGSSQGYVSYQHSTDSLQIATANSERMRIDSSGRLLLGTTTEGQSSADDLTIATSGNTGITIRSGTSNTGNIYFSDATSGNAEYSGYIEYDHSSNFLRFGAATAEAMRIDSNGDVGIGTTNPGQRLEVRQTSASHAIIACNRPNSDTFAIALGNNSSNNGVISVNSTDLLFGEDNAGTFSEFMRIDSSGRVKIGTTTEGDGLADNFTVADSSNCGITLRSGTSSLGSIFFSDATSGAGEYQGQMVYDHSADSLKFVVDGTETIRITSTQDIQCRQMSNTVSQSSSPSDVAPQDVFHFGNRQYRVTRFASLTASGSGTGTFNMGRLWIQDSSVIRVMAQVQRFDATTNKCGYIDFICMKNRGTGLTGFTTISTQSVGNETYTVNASSSNSHFLDINFANGDGGVIYSCTLIADVTSKTESF